jgi:hypothetical protein
MAIGHLQRKRYTKVYERVATRLRAKDFGGARAIIENARGLGAMHAASLSASVYEAMGRRRDAERILRTAARRAPHDVRPLRELVELYRDGGSGQRARRLLDKLWARARGGRFKESRRTVYEWLVELEASFGPEASIRHCAEALMMYPQSPAIRAWLRDVLCS